jgi:magnesium chelatase accessory protein
VLLLLHGTGASTHSFRALMPRLAERFTVVAPDLPGHALSEVPPWFEPSPAGMAAALDELLVELALTPEVAVGHSAGVAVLARMVLDGAIAPRLVVGLGAALVPFRGVARKVFPRTARALALASRFVPLHVRDGARVEQMLRSTGSLLDARGVELYRRLSEQPRHVAGVLAMMAHWDLDPLFDELPSLDVPLVLFAGELDLAVPLDQARVAAARAARGRVVVVPGTGHLLHEEKPDEIARRIFDEVDALPAARLAHPAPPSGV